MEIKYYFTHIKKYIHINVCVYIHMYVFSFIIRLFDYSMLGEKGGFLHL